MNMNYSRLMRIIILIGFSLILFSLIIIRENPASGYENSVYSAIPLAWAALICSILCGFTIFICHIFILTKQKYSLISAFLMIILSNTIIILMYNLRGESLYGRLDILSHIGLSLDIIQTGSFHPDNIYPFMHILAAEISEVSNQSIMMVFPILIILFFLLFILGIVILSRFILRERKAILLSIIFSSVFLISIAEFEGIPTAFSILSIPLVLFSYFKAMKYQSRDFSLLLIFLLAIFTFFHPFTMFVLLLALIAMNIMNRYLISRNYMNYQEKVPFRPMIIGFLIFLVWLFSHDYFWTLNITEFSKWLAGESTFATASKGLFEIFKILNLNGIEIFMLLLKKFGHILLLLILTAISMFIIVRKIFFRSDRTAVSSLLLFMWFPITISILIVNLLFTILNFGIWRSIAITVIIMPILAAFSLRELFIRENVSDFSRRKKAFTASAVIIIVAVPSIIGILNFYPSPWTGEINQQVTEMDIEGYTWHYEFKNREIYDNYIRTSRFADVILGFKQNQERLDIPYVERASTKMPNLNLPQGLVPAHFNYSNPSVLNEEYASIYIPISKYDIIFYTEIYPELEEFSEEDFMILETDSRINRLYSNGEFDVNLLKG